MKKELHAAECKDLFTILKMRFEKNKKRFPNLEWSQVLAKLEQDPSKLWSLNQMEETGGEPDLVAFNQSSNEFVFYDCSEESPKGRRSLCYDRKALESRKAHKPKSSSVDMANEMGVSILNEEEYRRLQELGNFDTKTSSWLATPKAIRDLGGAIFGDYRFGQIFIYHNGAESYYAARGFRASLTV